MITKQLITMMGGTLTVRSQEGKGSTFTITLPAVVGSEKGIGREEGPRTLLLSRSLAQLWVHSFGRSRLQSPLHLCGRSLLLLTTVNSFPLLQRS